MKVSNISRQKVLRNKVVSCLNFVFQFKIVKEIYNERGIKDQDHDLVRKAWTAEFEKVSRQLHLAQIIHDTYVKETARFHKKKEDEERRKRELSEEKRVAEAELVIQIEIA